MIDEEGLVYLIQVAVHQDLLQEFYEAVEPLIFSDQIVGTEDISLYNGYHDEGARYD